MKRIYTARRPPKMRPPHPGALLAETLEALGVTVTDAARELRVSRQMLHAILAGRAAVSPEMALRLGRWCGNGPHLWLALQRRFDLWEAECRLADRLAAIPRRKAA